MAGFDNDVMYADNVDFSGGTPVSAKITSNGQLLIGSTASPNIRVGTPTNGNNIQWTLGSGSITAAVVGPPSPTTLTNHGVVIGQGTSALVATAAGSAGQVLQSGGASADPTYSTATYPAVATGTGTIMRADGTNWVATTATYPATTTVSQILYSSSTNVVGGITTANNGVLVTNNTGVPSLLANGTAGQVLTANTGAPPSWQSNPALAMSVVVQRKTATGAFTYTPTAGMLFVIVELVGGGGGSGGIAATSANVAFSGSGGGGGYARFLLSAAQVGASLTGSVGIAGTAGTAGNNAGGAGGDTTLATAAAWTCAGGSAGAGSGAGAGGQQAGANGGAVTTGTGTIIHTSDGNQGGYSGGSAATFVVSGMGGSSLLGIGGPANVVATINNIGNSTSGAGFGSGASSSTAFGTNVATAGAVGKQGVAIFTEYL